MQQPDPIEFIKTVQQSFVGAVTVFTSGSCYQFFKILKSIYPDAEPYQDRGGHVVTRIGSRFFDIHGELEGKFVPLDSEEEKRLERCKFILNVAGLMELSWDDQESRFVE